MINSGYLPIKIHIRDNGFTKIEALKILDSRWEEDGKGR